MLRLLRAKADGLEAASDAECGPTAEVNSETATPSRFAHDFSRIPVPAPTPITIQPKLAVNTPGDIYEQEADHLAEQVMRMHEPQLQRACACGGECSKCQTEQSSHEHHRLQTKRVSSSDSGQTVAPPIVHEVLASPGRPLDASARAFFEPRFGHDFSSVRLHSDPAAEQSAREVNANAYTVGHNIVFGAGRLAPGTHEGRRLLAHELAHVVQQSGNRGLLQRDGGKKDDKKSASGAKAPDPANTPCLKSPDCAKPIPGSSWDFARKAERTQAATKKDEEEERQREKEAAEKKKQEAAKPAPKPEPKPQPKGDKDTSGKGGKAPKGEMTVTYGDVEILDMGPPGPASFLKKVIKKEDQGLLGGIWDVVIDPSIGVSTGAQLGRCELASPKPDPQNDPDARCISVPRYLETEAEEYDSGAKKVGGRSRYDWMTSQLSTITHEKAHFLFDSSSGPVLPGKPFDVQKVFDFSPDIFHFDLGEMNSILSEFSVQYDRAPKDTRDQVATKFLLDKIKSPGEGIRGILKKVRCVATCADVDDGIKKVVAYQVWTVKKTELFLKIVRNPDLHLDWPK